MFVTKNKNSKVGFIYNVGDERSADLLARYIAKNNDGCWILSNPVNGEVVNGSIRSEGNLTSFRHAVLESDLAPEDLWLRLLMQLHLPIVALYTSGNRSVHALFRTGAGSKEDFDRIVRDKLMPLLIPFGADPGALTAVRLTRLPCVTRGDNGREQKLLWLYEKPNGGPIAKTVRNCSEHLKIN